MWKARSRRLGKHLMCSWKWLSNSGKKQLCEILLPLQWETKELTVCNRRVTVLRQMSSLFDCTIPKRMDATLRKPYENTRQRKGITVFVSPYNGLLFITNNSIFIWSRLCDLCRIFIWIHKLIHKVFVLILWLLQCKVKCRNGITSSIDLKITPVLYGIKTGLHLCLWGHALLSKI